MNQVEEEQLKMEIAHIFESGANEIRILEMVKSFNNRPKQENNFLIPDVIGSVSAHIHYDLSFIYVVSSYFTSLDIGSKFEIIKNSSGHGFEIGETVTLEYLTSADDDEYKFRGKKTYWWCGFAEVKKL